LTDEFEGFWATKFLNGACVECFIFKENFKFGRRLNRSDELSIRIEDGFYAVKD